MILKFESPEFPVGGSMWHDTLGEYNQAKELHEKALIIFKQIFGEDHADVATSYSNLASVYYSLKEYTQAKELHEKVLTIRKNIFGGDHADVATSYNNLALVYQQLGDHADVAISYNNLVSVYSCLG